MNGNCIVCCLVRELNSPMSDNNGSCRPFWTQYFIFWFSLILKLMIINETWTWVSYKKCMIYILWLECGGGTTGFISNEILQSVFVIPWFIGSINILKFVVYKTIQLVFGGLNFLPRIHYCCGARLRLPQLKFLSINVLF